MINIIIKIIIIYSFIFVYIFPFYFQLSFQTLLRLQLSDCTRFNVSRVILLYQFYCDLSNPTVCKFIVNRQDYCDQSYPTVLVSLCLKYVIATTAVLTLMPKFLFYSWVTTDCYTSICAVIFIAAAADLVDLADGFASSPMASPSSPRASPISSALTYEAPRKLDTE